VIGMERGRVTVLECLVRYVLTAGSSLNLKASAGAGEDWAGGWWSERWTCAGRSGLLSDRRLLWVGGDDEAMT
jgi:hypothetical protein